MTHDDLESPVADLPPPDAAAPAWPGDAALPHDARRLWIGWSIGLLVTLCLFADFGTQVLMDFIRPEHGTAVIVYACFGLFPLQAVALTAWLVFGRTSFLVRLAAHWSIIAFLFLFWVAGVAMVGGTSGRRADEVWTILCGLPLASLGLQLPLWPLRLYARWRVEPLLETDEKQAPLSIRDIMLGTALVAVTLTAARLAGNTSRGSNDWLMWGVLVAGMAALSLFSLAPAARAMLRSGSAGRGYWIVALYAAAIYIVVIVGGLWFSGPRQNLWQIFGFSITAASFAGSLAVALHIVRACGYRLKIGRE